MVTRTLYLDQRRWRKTSIARSPSHRYRPTTVDALALNGSRRMDGPAEGGVYVAASGDRCVVGFIDGSALRLWVRWTRGRLLVLWADCVGLSFSTWRIHRRAKARAAAEGQTEVEEWATILAARSLAGTMNLRAPTTIGKVIVEEGYTFVLYRGGAVILLARARRKPGGDGLRRAVDKRSWKRRPKIMTFCLQNSTVCLCSKTRKCATGLSKRFDPAETSSSTMSRTSSVAVPAPAARRRAGAPRAVRRAAARRDARSVHRDDRDLGLRGAHVARPQDRHRLRLAARRARTPAVIDGAEPQCALRPRPRVAALRQMKYMPEFRFRLDTSFDEHRQDRRAADARRRCGATWVRKKTTTNANDRE